MFHIKICGIANIEDGLAAAQAGADAVGLNFYPKSPRYVSPAVAREIAHALPQGVMRVGVFVNASLEDIIQRYDETPLDVIQLHGDEPPEFLAQLGNRPVMKAFRLKPGSLEPVTSYLDRCRVLKTVPRMVLIDSQSTGQYGGSGETCDWNIARRYMEEIRFPPLVLAGGLNPENVAEAIRAVRPAAVDVASGVESSPGKKNRTAIEVFVHAAQSTGLLIPPILEKTDQ